MKKNQSLIFNNNSKNLQKKKKSFVSKAGTIF